MDKYFIGWVVIFGISVALTGNAEIHKWVDEKGATHYGECPPSDWESTEIKIETGPTPDQLQEAKKRASEIKRALSKSASKRPESRPPVEAPGSTGAAPMLQRDVLRLLWIFDTAKDQTCDTRRILDTNIVKIEGGEDKKVIERWTISRCGKRIDYFVEFTSAPIGGTTFKIKDGP